MNQCLQIEIKMFVDEQRVFGLILGHSVEQTNAYL